MFAKLHVKGAEQAPLYRWLVASAGGADIEWNFTKFVVGRDGKVRTRLSTKTKPESQEMASAIESALREP
jgi:glutathione peroxidase